MEDGGGLLVLKNLPQPLLVKEGGRERHYLSGNGTSALLDTLLVCADIPAGEDYRTGQPERRAARGQH